MTTWNGSKPIVCDICLKSITEKFIDGRTCSGPWGILCTSCHKKYGVGLGTGKGQLYIKQLDGNYLKTAG